MEPYWPSNVPSGIEDKDLVFVATKGPMKGHYFDLTVVNDKERGPHLSYLLGFPVCWIQCVPKNGSRVEDIGGAFGIDRGWSRYMNTIEGEDPELDGGYALRSHALAAGYSEKTLAV